MNKIDFYKNKEFVKRYKGYYLPIITMIFISIFISNYKNMKLEECIAIEAETYPIKKLESNKAKLEFISKHKFSGSSKDFENFIKELGQKNYAKIKQVNKLEDSVNGKIKITKFEIKGFFWHDSFIFNFIDEIQDFSPGFLKILSIDIDKFSKIITEKPIMKVEILCKIFQK